MIDHVSIGVRDVAKTKRFYDAALKPLGYQCLSEGKDSLGYGRGAVALWISTAEHPVPPDMKSGLHFSFTAPTPNSVDAFHAAALGRSGPTAAVQRLSRSVHIAADSAPTPHTAPGHTLSVGLFRRSLTHTT